MLLSEKEVSGAYMLFFQRNYILHCPRNLEAVTCSPPVLPWLCRPVEVGFLLKTYSGILINFLPDKKKKYIILERGGRTIGEIRLINTYLCILLLEWIATHVFILGTVREMWAALLRGCRSSTWPISAATSEGTSAVWVPGRQQRASPGLLTDQGKFCATLSLDVCSRLRVIPTDK